MAQVTKEEIRAALDTILEERQIAVEKMRLPDPTDRSKPFSFPPLPKPASSDEIQRLEEALGQKLPPSYRHFLQMYNGLPQINMGDNLLSVEEVIKSKMEDPPEVLERALPLIERDSTEGLIIFGGTPLEPSFIFDSTKRDPDGEWAVIDYDEQEELYEEYANVLELFVKIIATIRRIGNRLKKS